MDYAPVKRHKNDSYGGVMFSSINAWRRRNVKTEQAALFWFCSLGYMAPWTFIGSLIAFFKASRNANFYVELYGVYYAMGLPVSFLQQRYDQYWDMKFGSSKMYLLRGQLNFLVILVVVLLMPIFLLQRNAMLALMAALGVSSWMLHGTACMLASMVSTSAISALQTGFRTPELLAIIACYYLDIGSTATPGAIRIFFIVMASLAVSGLVAWTALVLSPRVQAILADKDRCVDELDMTKAPLIPEKADAGAPALKRSPSTASADRDGDAAAAGGGAAGPRDGGDRDGGDSDDGDADAEAAAAAAEDASSALSGGDMEQIARQVRSCRVALFWTMFGSIFTAAFFAYTESSSGIDIEQVLYFTRLFGDLFGRPFTSLPRPRCLRTGDQLAAFAVGRLCFAVIFFIYIFVPGVPQNDLFIIIDIGIFSVSSGYLGIISYEYAARDFKSTAAKAYAATLMNTTFQVSMFLAVIFGILISELVS